MNQNTILWLKFADCANDLQHWPDDPQVREQLLERAYQAFKAARQNDLVS